MSSDLPLVSVVIPAYNRVQLLERSVRSAFSQTYTNIEVIVIDDGSTEDVRGALKNFDDPRLKYFHRDENKGISSARNFGITLTHGKYVAFLDSDDEWREGKIAAQLERMKSLGPEYRVCYTNLEFYDDVQEKTVKITKYATEGDMLVTLLRYAEIASSLLVDKDALSEAGGFDSRMGWGEDWDFYIRLARVTKFACVKDPLTIYHLHDKGQISKKTEKNPMIADSLMVLYKKNKRIFSRDRKAWGAFLVDIGYYQANSGRKRLALKTFLSSIYHCPMQKSAYLSVARLVKGWDRHILNT